MTRLHAAPPSYRQTQGPIAGNARPTPTGWSIPVLIGITQGQSANGTLTVPYPEGALPGDQVFAVCQIGPNLVVDGYDYYGGGGMLANPTSGSTYPYESFLIPTIGLVASCSWPAGSLPSPFLDAHAVYPNTFPGPLSDQWTVHTVDHWYGVVGTILGHIYTGPDDAPLTITTAPAAPVSCWVVCVRGGFASGTTGSTADLGYYNQFWYRGGTQEPDPGGIGHVAEHPFSTVASGSNGTGRFSLFFTTAVTLVQLAGSSYPAFPPMAWTNPVHGVGYAMPVASVTEAASDPQGNKVWLFENPPVLIPPEPFSGRWLEPYYSSDYPFYRDDYPNYYNSPFTSTGTILDSPVSRTDRYWEYFGPSGLYTHIIDQSFNVSAYALAFRSMRGGLVPRSTGLPLADNRRVRRLPEGIK